jgi:hypothetical protein
MDEGWRPLRTRPASQSLEASPFSRLAVAHALAVSGDALVTVALAGSLFFDISPSAARGRVALSLVLTMAPFAVVAPFLGPAIDRVRGGRRFTMVLANFGRALACLFMARYLSGLLLFPIAFVLLVLSKTHAVAKSSLVPTVVESKDELVGANSRLALISAVMGVLAAVPGVAILKLLDAAWVVRLAAVVFLVAAAASLRIFQVRPDDPSRRSAASEEVRHAGIRLAATATGVLRASVGFLTFLVAFALRRDGAPAGVVGGVRGGSMAGTLVGAVVAPPLRRRVVEEHLLAGSLAILCLGAVAAARLGGRPAAVLLGATLGLAASAGKLAFDSLVQRDAEDAVQGRWFARLEAALQLAWVAGGLVPVVLTVSLQVGFVILALVAALAAVGYLVGLHVPRPGATSHASPSG